MAKVRVYELAKELNMESKDLVEKLIASGVNIKNYMSTLDEEAISKAKDIVSGRLSEVVEEKRIKPTVIRRRKKVMRVEPEVPAEKVEEFKEEAEVEEEELPAGEAEIVEAAPVEIPEEVTEPEEEEEEIEEPLPAVEAVDEEAPAEEEQPSVPETVVEVEPVIQEAKPEIPEEKVVERPAEVKPKPKKGKKKKLDQPARIIKRPEEGPLRALIAKQIEKKEPEPKPSKPSEPDRVFQKAEVPFKVPAAWLFQEAEEEPDRGKKAKPAKKKKEKKADEPEVEAVGIGRRRKREVYERDELYEGRELKRQTYKAAKKSKEITKVQKHTEITVPKAIKRRIKVGAGVTVGDLARAMGVKAAELIRSLMKLGDVVGINQTIDFETASVLADEFGYELELDTFEEDRFISEREDRPEDLKPRPPVVTIMGHVDHGKTSLLDYIRKSNIAEGESGGITQHIGAYYVEAEGGDIVFLDTPGHEAFTAMRARGAQATDLIVLVVAADDGVMPQTKEAINHARAAAIPIVVAVNKIDKPEADPAKVRRELAELDLTPEEWGGETIFGEISAKTGEGVDELLSLILLQAEVLELKANPDKPGRGTIIEAKLDKSKGPVATVLVNNGTLRQGDYFICGEHFGKVRAMQDQHGKKMDFAGPSVPVEVYGISGVPMAGDAFIVVQDEKTAKQVIEHRKERTKKQEISRRGVTSLDDLFRKIQEGEAKELNIVLKADVQGSVEAISETLLKLSTDQVKLKIIHSAVGAVTESDVMLASASGAIVIGFGVRANPRVTEVAEKENVDIRYYDVIYSLTNDIRLAMVGLLEPTYTEHTIGHANIKEVFRIPKVGAIAGCYVTDGHVERNAKVRLLRDDMVVFDGRIASLKRFKEDAREVQSGYECGIGLENFQDLKPGDVFEVYKLEEVRAEL